MVRDTSWYFITTLNNEVRKIPIRVVSDYGGQSSQSQIIHEHPGSDGGTQGDNGRMTDTASLTCTLVGEDLKEIQDNYNILYLVKQLKLPVRLVGPIIFTQTGRYTLKDITPGLASGNTQGISLSINLTEYKERNTKTSQVNLVSFQPFTEFVTLYKSRTGQG